MDHFYRRLTHSSSTATLKIGRPPRRDVEGVKCHRGHQQNPYQADARVPRGRLGPQRKVLQEAQLEKETRRVSEYNLTPRLDRRAAFLSSADREGAARPVSAFSEVAEQWRQIRLRAGLPNHGRPRRSTSRPIGARFGRPNASRAEKSGV